MAEQTAALLPAARTSRMSFVDNLRILLTTLVILHHVAVMYSGIPLWYYTEPATSAGAGFGLSVFMLINQAWFMGAFFLLSGYFTPGSYDRKGTGAFLRSRLTRLGIPLLVFYFVLNPLLSLPKFPGGSFLDFYWLTVGSGPLWFVIALLVFDCCYAVFRSVVRKPAVRRDPRPPTGPVVAGFVVVLALVTFALRAVVPIGTFVPVIGFPTSSYLPQYVSFFIVGIVAYRRGWFHAITPRMGWVGLGMALAATAVLVPLALGGDWTGNGTLDSLFYALWDSTFAVGVVLALLTLFRSKFNDSKFNTAKGQLSGRVFTVYVIHALVVTALGYGLADLAIPTLLKFAIAGVVAVPACFLLAGPVRRIPGVRRVL